MATSSSVGFTTGGSVWCSHCSKCLCSRSLSPASTPHVQQCMMTFSASKPSAARGMKGGAFTTPAVAPAPAPAGAGGGRTQAASSARHAAIPMMAASGSKAGSQRVSSRPASSARSLSGTSSWLRLRPVHKTLYMFSALVATQWNSAKAAVDAVVRRVVAAWTVSACASSTPRSTRSMPSGSYGTAD